MDRNDLIQFSSFISEVDMSMVDLSAVHNHLSELMTPEHGVFPVYVTIEFQGNKYRTTTFNFLVIKSIERYLDDVGETLSKLRKMFSEFVEGKNPTNDN